MSHRCFPLSYLLLVAVTFLTLTVASPLNSDEQNYWIHTFKHHELSDKFYSEGATFGDIDGDGNNDIISGPFWFEGPDFKTRHEFYQPKVFNVKGYSNNFFPYVYDFNKDGKNDILIIGFPGQDASWFENPGKKTTHWKRHLVVDEVSNESPSFTDIDNDGKPEIVGISKGRYGYSEFNWDKPHEKCRFIAISPDHKYGRFTHGMGVDDVNGDGRKDLIEKNGWYEQPSKLDGSLWKHHRFDFVPGTAQKVGVPGAGGAQMYAYDVDGDGDQDIITSRNAHNWGLVWYENLASNGAKVGQFHPHLIMGRPDEPAKYSLRIAQLHGIDLVDMDGDGLKDIVTGVRVWAHYGDKSAEPPGKVYWFKLVRQKDKTVDWVPQKIDHNSGVGVMVKAGDVDGDQLPDVVVGNKKGIYYLKHQRTKATRAAWKRTQPKVFHTKGLSPQQAVEEMTFPEGFEVELAAGEPLVHQPVAFTVDSKGRLWVAEAHTYPTRVGGTKGKWNAGKDKIVILEDRDQDGSFETRKVFIENVNLISALEVGFGGVWVGAAPYLLFFPDADKDDRPDGEPKILLDGFGIQDTHETLNSFRWGPDGWLYSCHGIFTHSLVGKPGTPVDQRTPMNAAYWRYHPQRHEVDVFAWGTSNPWGMDFNDYGQAFSSACVIPHLYHVIQGARYVRQAGRHFNKYVYDDIKTIADHLHFVGSLRDHAWWGHEPRTPQNTLDAGGGHAHCGMMVYLGDSFPDTYRNRLYMNNIHGNRINEEITIRNGSGYIGTHSPDIVIANDAWFRGIALRLGPTGDFYFSDWYDKNACHRTNPLVWDRSNGRIYRLSYVGPSGKARRLKVDLQKKSNRELVDLQLHKNDWFVRTARRILQERQPDPTTHKSLMGIVFNNKDTTRRLRALWALHVTQGLQAGHLGVLLKDQDEYIRAWAVQLSLEEPGKFSSLYPSIAKLGAREPSPTVRLYLASALQRLPENFGKQLAQALVKYGEDATDHNLPLMLWYGIENLVSKDPQWGMSIAAESNVPTVSRFTVRRLAAEVRHLDQIIQAINRTPSESFLHLILDETIEALKGHATLGMPKSWGLAFDKLIALNDAKIESKAETIAVKFGDKRIFPLQRRVLGDSSRPIDRRRHALKVLLTGDDQESIPIFHRVLAEPALRSEILKGLSKFNHAQTPAAILKVYPELTVKEKLSALNTLASRKPYAEKLVQALEKGDIARKDLSAFIVRQIDQVADDTLRSRLEKVWGAIRKTSDDKIRAIAKYKELFNKKALAAADLSKGRDVFSKTCQSCHQLFGTGGKIAPDLTGSNRGNLDYILENLVDPNAVVGKDYQLNNFITRDGQLISGLVASESDTALTIQTLDKEVVVAKNNLLRQTLSPNSMMPEGLLDELKPADAVNLIAYLASPIQVLQRGSDLKVDPKTHKIPGVIEGESLKISKPTGGSVSIQGMNNFGAGKWSGNKHVWWVRGKPGSKIQFEFPVKNDGLYRIELGMTMAVDYGVFKFRVDGEDIGGAVDLYDKNVIPTGPVVIGEKKLSPGKHILEVEVVGSNPKAVKAHMFGLDYIYLNRQ